jgi:hypothetical protein
LILQEVVDTFATIEAGRTSTSPVHGNLFRYLRKTYRVSLMISLPVLNHHYNGQTEAMMKPKRQHRHCAALLAILWMSMKKMSRVLSRHPTIRLNV